MDKDLIQALVRGSKALGRMRREIDIIIRLVFRLVEPKDIEDLDPGFKKGSMMANFSYEKPTWKIYAGEKFIDLSITVFENGGEKVIYSSQGYDKNRARNIPQKYVKDIYRGLPRFLEAMFENFPQLKDRLGFILSATSEF